MTKRDKADPRQLFFVFENPEGVREEGEVSSPPPIPALRPPPSEERTCTAPRSVSAAPASSAQLAPPPGTHPAIAYAYRAPHQLSGPDPGLTALCASWLSDIALFDLAQKLTVVWNRRFSSAAGVARYGPNRIELNPALVEFDGEIERTLRHELAHLVARHRNPKKRIQPHGAEWRRACADLGIPGESVYHSLPFKSRRRRRKHAYRCASCADVVTRVRPLKGHCACYACCKKFSNGRYDTRFKLEKIPFPEEKLSPVAAPVS